jgi:phosphoribosylamine--glycine ligase
MVKYGVPTAQYWEFNTTKALKDFIATAGTWPLVIKLDGLAAGKGVGVCMSRSEADRFIADTVHCDGRVLVEEFLDGEEASVLGICDGKTVQPLIAAQDHNGSLMVTRAQYRR